jgi:hypothetical protein
LWQKVGGIRKDVAKEWIREEGKRERNRERKTDQKKAEARINNEATRRGAFPFSVYSNRG